MRRQLLTLLAGMAVITAGLTETPARADVFYSGRVDVNPAFGGNVIAGVKEFSGYSGYNFSNLDQATGIVTVLGFAQFSTSRSLQFQGVPANPSDRLVAVYALQGRFTGNLMTGDLSADFNGGLGAMRIYDHVVSPLIDSLNPATWVDNIANLNQGVVSAFDLGLRPTATLQGPPGGLATIDMTGFDPTRVNTANATVGEIAPSATANVKFHYLSGGEGGTLLNYNVPGYLVNPLDPTLLVSLTQRIAKAESEAWAAAGNLPNTETVFKGLLGVDFVKAGDTFDPHLLGANGDTILAGNGGTAIPGSQTPVPEPAALASSLVGSGLLSAVGMLYRRLRRKV